MTRNRTKNRYAKKTYSIIVDGQTEVWYLELMKDYENFPRIDIKPELPKKKKLEELFELVRSNAEIYDKVIWLLDLDVIIKNNQVNELKKYVNKLSRNDKVEVLVNNPCLEFWFLLHFKETGRYFSKCDDVIKELGRNNKFVDYEKTEKHFKNAKTNIYKRLKPFQMTAIRNSEKLGKLDYDNIHSPKAEIYKIFDVLSKTDDN